jgi:hypothetical protein
METVFERERHIRPAFPFRPVSSAAFARREVEDSSEINSP